MKTCVYLQIVSAALLVAACQDPGRDPAAPEAEAVPPGTAANTGKATASSPGKPSAPIAIDYTVNGTPIVGHPLSIDLEVESTAGERPVTLQYRIIDTSALAFPESQLRRVAMGLPDEAGPAIQQVTVIPQREGRLYLNVTAEIETEDGLMLKSMAIPIQVGSAPPELETNGALKKDAEGEAIESLPADDR